MCKATLNLFDAKGPQSADRCVKVAFLLLTTSRSFHSQLRRGGGKESSQLCCRFAVSPMPREGRGNAATLEVIVGRLATVLGSQRKNLIPKFTTAIVFSQMYRHQRRQHSKVQSRGKTYRDKSFPRITRIANLLTVGQHSVINL